MLVEGWNIGWDGDWFANGGDFSFTKPYPDFDLPRVAAYAKKKGVHIMATTRPRPTSPITKARSRGRLESVSTKLKSAGAV